MCSRPSPSHQPQLAAAHLLALGGCRFQVTPLTSSTASEQDRDCGTLGSGPSPTRLPLLQDEQQHMSSAEAGAAFRALQHAAEGLEDDPAASFSAAAHGASAGSGYGAWRPFPAPLRANERVTAASHFQDTRHLEFDLRGSGMEWWEPGDLLAVLPRQPPHMVSEVVRRLGGTGQQRVRVSAACGGGGAMPATMEATVESLLQVSGR